MWRALAILFAVTFGAGCASGNLSSGQVADPSPTIVRDQPVPATLGPPNRAVRILRSDDPDRRLGVALLEARLRAAGFSVLATDSLPGDGTTVDVLAAGEYDVVLGSGRDELREASEAAVLELVSFVVALPGSDAEIVATKRWADLAQLGPTYELALDPYERTHRDQYVEVYQALAEDVADAALDADLVWEFAEDEAGRFLEIVAGWEAVFQVCEERAAVQLDIATLSADVPTQDGAAAVDLRTVPVATVHEFCSGL